jgi:hypothetical protein
VYYTPLLVLWERTKKKMTYKRPYFINVFKADIQGIPPNSCNKALHLKEQLLQVIPAFEQELPKRTHTSNNLWRDMNLNYPPLIE